VNLLHPFSPAFCFEVIVCFSLEYKILGLAGAPPSCSGCQPAGSILYQPAGSFISTRWFHFISMRSRLGQALSFCFFWVKPKEETLPWSETMPF